MEMKVKHLEMIENIIQRMANNSFLLKGWSISLIVAIFVLSDTQMNQRYFLFCYVPVILFWALDSYYLQMERKYITLYNKIRVSNELVDFDLSIKDITYDNIKNSSLKYVNCLFSVSEWLFYCPIAIVLTVVFKNDILIILNNVFRG